MNEAINSIPIAELLQWGYCFVHDKYEGFRSVWFQLVFSAFLLSGYLGNE